MLHPPTPRREGGARWDLGVQAGTRGSQVLAEGACPGRSRSLFSPPQLLTAQGVRCTHIYSSLDQTARKINIARFAQGKCPVLLVTDVAARGLDLPMLDNVVNYSFPAKAKLFLHRVGGCRPPGRGPGTQGGDREGVSGLSLGSGFSQPPLGWR